MTKREIDAALPEWKRRLRLEDWTITARTAPAAAMEVDGVACVGLCHIHPEDAEAEILLRRGAGLEVLLHELLHVRLEGHAPQTDDYNVMFERALNALAQAMVELKEGRE